MPHDMPFIDRNPTHEEELFLQALMSSFSDGSGWETDPDGTSRIGWRQIERMLSIFFSGSTHTEDKDVFDLIVDYWSDPRKSVGISVKSKILSGRKQIFRENTDPRLYMELSNSHAKFWQEVDKELGLDESCFRAKTHAQEIGDCVLNLISRWHVERKKTFGASGGSLHLPLCRFVSVSFSDWEKHVGRSFQVHSYDLSFPPVKWTYHSDKCLRGLDDKGNHLFDWYGLSGGQLKYYPDSNTALHCSSVIQMKRLAANDIVKQLEASFAGFSKVVDALSPKQRELLGRV